MYNRVASDASVNIASTTRRQEIVAVIVDSISEFRDQPPCSCGAPIVYSRVASDARVKTASTTRRQEIVAVIGHLLRESGFGLAELPPGGNVAWRAPRARRSHR
ncbi:hypothetical protein GCM10007977_012080 [Dactylosporangium sucinum]|uniref:Uncharacterized protein n=1 Tax=Dactylosporangium sucinum TaxID=1424081 RepID=A0A917T6N7_9ACTN|nr:hypothetical protein GCM10007977_012080 [Dactylosporangium sucinum]